MTNLKISFNKLEEDIDFDKVKLIFEEINEKYPSTTYFPGRRAIGILNKILMLRSNDNPIIIEVLSILALEAGWEVITRNPQSDQPYSDLLIMAENDVYKFQDYKANRELI